MSHKKNILNTLLKYGSITPAEAWQNFNCMRLAARIHDLRHDGYSINTTIIESVNGARYARYTLANFKK